MPIRPMFSRRAPAWRAFAAGVFALACGGICYAVLSIVLMLAAGCSALATWDRAGGRDAAEIARINAARQYLDATVIEIERRYAEQLAARPAESSAIAAQVDPLLARLKAAVTEYRQASLGLAECPATRDSWQWARETISAVAPLVIPIAARAAGVGIGGGL